MKNIALRLIPALWALAVSSPSLTGADSDNAQGPGYVVTVDLELDESGKPRQVTLVHSDNQTLGRIAVEMAKRMTFEPVLENGRPVAATRRAPLFFPVEGDGGPEANQRPLPKLRIAVEMPNYPFEMRRRNESGGAILRLVVDKEGHAKSVKVVRASHAELGQLSSRAVAKWRFTPAQENGQAIEAEVHLAIAFQSADGNVDWRWYAAPRPAMETFVITGRLIPVR
jgi:TonB family protein